MNLAAPSMAGAFGVDDGATAGSCGPGRVHDRAGVALIGDDQQQVVTGIFQGAFLLQLKGLVFGEEQQGALAADAAYRDDECDAGTRHINAHLAAQGFLDAGPAVRCDDGKEHGFFGLFQPEGGKRLLNGGAGTTVRRLTSTPKLLYSFRKASVVGRSVMVTSQ